MEDKIIKTELVEWEKLKLFQPADLKKMSKSQLNKLKTSLKKNGFESPFYVWQDKENIWCLDGHMRIPIMKLLQDEGEHIPLKLPANFIKCKDKAEAKKAVLIYNSKYADISKEGFLSFIDNLDLNNIMDEFTFDDILEQENFLQLDVKEKELKPYEKYHVLISYTNSNLIEMQKILNQLQEIKGIEIEQSAN